MSRKSPGKKQPVGPADKTRTALPGQVVLVLQGGGALGAYQLGVYRALHEAGIEPEWVIGTSIGAINAALIAGNPIAQRLEKLQTFWQILAQEPSPMSALLAPWGLASGLPNARTVMRGIPGFFKPNPASWGGIHARVGVEHAAHYSTQPLNDTLTALVDFDQVARGSPRLTVGAVNAVSGVMRYFDSRETRLGVAHVMASGALPPAFPAVRIDGEPYWDGGIYSNTPIEAVLDDYPRRNSLILSVNVWHQTGPEPESIWQVMGRQKDIQYASRAASHIDRQKQIHRLRHIIQQLSAELPVSRRTEAHVRELSSWGCRTTMHVAHLIAPALPGEDSTKDIDFTSAGIQARSDAGYADTQSLLARAPWSAVPDPIEGVIEYL